MLPAGTWWGVKNGYTYTPYNYYIGVTSVWPNGYPYGCGGSGLRSRGGGDLRHHGLDIAAPTGSNLYAWGRCYVNFEKYYQYGYHRYISMHFPDQGYTLEAGHLLNGSQAKAGTWLKRGDVIGKIGTREDAMGTDPHVHYCLGRGNYKQNTINACSDMDPINLWRALSLPE